MDELFRAACDRAVIDMGGEEQYLTANMGYKGTPVHFSSTEPESFQFITKTLVPLQHALLRTVDSDS